MSDERVTPDPLAELRAIQRARTEDCPAIEDVLALFRSIEIQRDHEKKLWNPDVLKGLLCLGIDADEWQVIEDSGVEAFSKLAIKSALPRGDFTKEDFVLGAVRMQGADKASQLEIVTKWLPELLSEGKADFFEALAKVVRESREMRPDDIQALMPDDTMKDRATWTLVVGWTRSPFQQYDFPPFAFWTYDAITEFCEEFFKITYGREGIRRRISELGLKFASIAWVRGLEHERDGSGFRLIFKKRRRSVKGHKNDTNP